MPDLTPWYKIVANGHSFIAFKRNTIEDINLAPKFNEGAINRKAILGGTGFSKQ